MRCWIRDYYRICCRIFSSNCFLTHWGRVTHICVSKLTTIGSDNGLSPGRRQAIIWTNAGILLIGPLGTNFSEILIGIQTFSFKEMHLKMSCAKSCPFSLSHNFLNAVVAVDNGVLRMPSCDVPYLDTTRGPLLVMLRTDPTALIHY